MNRIFSVGTPVRLTVSDLTGTIASEPFDIRGQTQYAVKLTHGFWDSSHTTFISHIIVHMDGLARRRFDNSFDNSFDNPLDIPEKNVRITP